MSPPTPPPVRNPDAVMRTRASLDRCLGCIRGITIRQSKASVAWNLSEWFASAILFALVGSAVLFGSPVSSKVADVTGLKALVAQGTISKESDPGWRAICVAAIAFHGLAQFFAKQSAKAVEAERNAKQVVIGRDKLLAALNTLRIDIESLERDPQEVARNLQDLIEQHPVFFRELQLERS
jgi:hypothetical protein